MAFGLLISALVSNPDKALTLLPVLFLFQTLLAGPLFDLAHQPVLGPLSYATNTRWGFWAVASTADLQSLPGGCTSAAPAPQAPTTGLFCENGQRTGCTRGSRTLWRLRPSRSCAWRWPAWPR
jgi:hypothetical protein